MTISSKDSIHRQERTREKIWSNREKERLTKYKLNSSSFSPLISGHSVAKIIAGESLPSRDGKQKHRAATPLGQQEEWVKKQWLSTCGSGRLRGVKWSLHRGHIADTLCLRSLHYDRNSSQITVMKYQWNTSLVGGHQNIRSPIRVKALERLE